MFGELRLGCLHVGEILGECVYFYFQLLAVELIRAGILGSLVDLPVFQENALEVSVLLEIVEVVGEQMVVFCAVEGLHLRLQQPKTTLIVVYLCFFEHIAAADPHLLYNIVVASVQNFTLCRLLSPTADGLACRDS